MKPIISENLKTDGVYAYYDGRFWVYGKTANEWFVSDLAADEYRKALAGDAALTPEDFMAESDVFAQMEDWEITTAMADSLLRAAKADKPRGAEEEDSEAEGCDISICQCRSCGRESCFAHGCAKECPADADESCLTTSCPEYIERKDVTCCCETTSARTEATAATLGESAAPVQSPQAETSPVSSQKNTGTASSYPSAEAAQSRNDSSDIATIAPTSAPTSFDYAGLSPETVSVLRVAEREIRDARKTYICRVSAAVAAAHEAVVSNWDNGETGKFVSHENTFFAWCASVGLSRSAAYRLLQVNALLSGATPDEQAALEAASPSLLYAAAKPSAPDELVQGVKSGDITTHKQYQEALAQLKAEREARERADAERDEARRRAAAELGRASAAQRREEEERVAAYKNHVRAEEAEAQRNALLEREKAYIDRIHELEARPVEVAVQQPTEEQIAAAAKRRTAMIEAQLHSVQERLDDALDRVSGFENGAYMAAAAFADSAARTIDSIRAAFWALAAELPDEDFADALAPLDEAVRKICDREWEDEA